MKIDKNYTYIWVCPETFLPVRTGVVFNGGVCSQCGHNEQGSKDHSIQAVGKWERPSILEWVVGKRKVFLVKEG